MHVVEQYIAREMINGRLRIGGPSKALRAHPLLHHFQGKKFLDLDLICSIGLINLHHAQLLPQALQLFHTPQVF